MRRDGSRFSLTLALLLGALLCGPAGWAQDDEDLPPGWRQFIQPVRERGGVGAAFFPSVYAAPDAVFDPRGFEVHMTPADDPGEELVFPAGEPFVPPPGRWRIWLQGPGAMSAHSHLVIFPESLGRRTAGLHTSPMAVERAGRVVLPDEEAAQPGQELWVIAADSPRDFRHELSRRRPASEASGDGVLMPAGTALAALSGPDRGRYAALSRPFTVRAGETVPAPLTRPAPDRAHLLVYAERPGHADADPLMDLAPTIVQGPARRRPDATVVTDWGVYCAWYDLASAPAILADGNRRVYLEPQTVDLPAGEIVRVDATLLDRPFLDVGLILPSRVREKPFTLAVRRMPEGEELAIETLRRDAGRYRFESLVQAPLEVVLDTHLGLFRERVDLTGRVEGFVTLEPALIELSGTVYRGGEPHAAEIELVSDFGDRVKARAGEDGAYRALALQPIRAVSVRLAGTTGDPWLHAFVRSITESRELDLELPPAAGGQDPALPAEPGEPDTEAGAGY